jgi:hypothetical protein
MALRDKFVPIILLAVACLCATLAITIPICRILGPIAIPFVGAAVGSRFGRTKDGFIIGVIVGILVLLFIPYLSVNWGS